MSFSAASMLVLYLLLLIAIGWKVGQVAGKAQGRKLKRIGQFLLIIFGLSVVVNLVASLVVFYFGFDGLEDGLTQVGSRGFADVIFGWSIVSSVIMALVAFPTFEWFGKRGLENM